MNNQLEKRIDNLLNDSGITYRSGVKKQLRAMLLSFFRSEMMRIIGEDEKALSAVDGLNNGQLSEGAHHRNGLRAELRQKVEQALRERVEG